MQLPELIESRITEGKAILQKVNTMRERSGPAINVVYYVTEDVDDCRNRISKWQLTSKEVLISAFGETHRYVVAFGETISRKNSGFDFKREFGFEVNQGLGILESISESLTLGLSMEKSNVPMAGPEHSVLSNDIFIVHGHNEEMKQSVSRVISKLGLNPIVLHEQANGGKTIIEKFETNAKEVSFAIILLSADDLAGSVKELSGVKGEELLHRLERRARQNVVFEMGYFAGKLGRSNVFFLLQDGVAKPGDLDGIVYTAYDPAGAWRFGLVKELKNAGYCVSADQLL